MRSSSANFPGSNFSRRGLRVLLTLVIAVIGFFVLLAIAQQHFVVEVLEAQHQFQLSILVVAAVER